MITHLVGDGTVVLENVVVCDTLREGDFLGNRKDVSEMLIWELVELLSMI